MGTIYVTTFLNLFFKYLKYISAMFYGLYNGSAWAKRLAVI